MALLERFAVLPIVPVSPAGVDRAALALSIQYELPTVYDAYYLIVAQRAVCDFWTDDRRLLRILAGRLPYVRWIGDYDG